MNAQRRHAYPLDCSLHRCRILGTDCSLGISLAGGSLVSGYEGEPQIKSLSAASRSPFVPADGYADVDDDIHGLEKDQTLGRGDPRAHEVSAWKERVSSLEQRLRIVEARLEATSPIMNPKLQQRHQRDRLSSLHLGAEKTSRTTANFAGSQSRKNISPNQPRRSPSQIHVNGDPSTGTEVSLAFLLVKHSAPYVGVQDILRCVHYDLRSTLPGSGRESDLWEREGWVDPVASGMVTEGQMQASWLSFSTTFVNILPLPSLIPATKSSPLSVSRHPFLRLVILIHVSHIHASNPLTLAQSRRIRSSLSASLQNLWTITPSLPVLRALIVLALVPAFTMIDIPDEAQLDQGGLDDDYDHEMDEQGGTEDMYRRTDITPQPVTYTPALPSPLHLLQVAKNMALALGLARATTDTVGHRGGAEGMDSSAGASGLEGYLLWHCIIQQETWAAMVMSRYLPCGSLPTYSDPIAELETLLKNGGAEEPASPMLSSSEHKNQQQTLTTSLDLARYVMHTAELQLIIEPILTLIGRTSQCPAFDEFTRAYEAFTKFDKEMERWYARFPRNSCELLLPFIAKFACAPKQYDYNAHLRIASWIQLLPRPVISELLFPLLQESGHALIRSGMQLIVSLTSHRDLQPLMPGGNHVLSICAWAGLLHIQAMFTGHANHEWTGRMHASHLVTFEDTVRKIHPGHAGSLMDALRDSMKIVPPRQDSDPPRKRGPDDNVAALKGMGQTSGPSPAPWSFPTNPAASAGMMSTSFQLHDSVSNLRHQQHTPSSTLPLYMDVRSQQHDHTSTDGYITHPAMLSTNTYGPTLSSLPSSNDTAHHQASSSTSQAVSGSQMMPFLGEFSPAEMQAFETWWYDMLNTDGTPEGIGAMLG
ncbi:hypothetical protein QFC22_004639 [Naganishia vaughanmartiniae]|uniref:Uncharacterized protein n=1 Tax=Naganishia vaughanmartiniae TaxID=1424756 RepID=A0ACC2X1Q2_9TREE|nr:hypothetical protein QFC22_004639 [Naganishia vaughanmartiniae]